MWWQIILSVLVFVFIIPFAVIYNVITRKNIKRINVSPNAPIVENDYRCEFTNGYTLGTLKSITPCKNGTCRIEFYPIDVEQGEEIKRPDVQSFIIKKEFIIPLAVGELSYHRQRIKTITKDKSLLPKKMRETLEADFLSKQGIIAHVEGLFGEGMKNSDEALAELMKNYSRTGATKSQMASIIENIMQVVKVKTIIEKQEIPPEKK